MKSVYRNRIKWIIYSTIISVTLVIKLFSFKSCKGEETEPVVYTQSQVDMQKELLKNELNTQNFLKSQMIKDSIKKEYLSQIDELNKEKDRLKASSSKLNKELKELKSNFSKSNSLEDCILLSNSQQKQLHNYETQITNLEQEAQYWCEAYETSEFQLLEARNFLITKDSTIMNLSKNLIGVQQEVQILHKQKEEIQEGLNKQKRRTKNTGIITGIIGFIAGIFI